MEKPITSLPFLLDFFVIGAQKCATSWLYYCLKDHPETQLPENKLERGYLGGPIFDERGSDWYFNRFQTPRASQKVGEVAVDYMLDENAPQQLLDYTDDPRFIALLRNPVDRMVSAYYWSVRRGQLPTKPVEDAFAPFLKEPVGFPRRFDNRYMDELVRRGFYGSQLKRYVDVFGPSRILIILYRDIKSKPEQVVQKVYDHVGVRDTYTPSSLDYKPKKNMYSKSISYLENKVLSHPLLAKVGEAINQFGSLIMEEKKQLPQAKRRKLMSLFRPHIEETSKIIRQVSELNRTESYDLEKLWL